MYLIERMKALLTVPKITVNPCGSQLGLQHGIYVFRQNLLIRPMLLVHSSNSNSVLI